MRKFETPTESRIEQLERRLEQLEEEEKSEADAAFRWELLTRCIKGI
jgi:hypothetical protein